MRVEDAEIKDLGVVRTLNETEVPHVNSITLDNFVWFLETADYFRVVRNGDEIEGFLIGFLPARPYNSPNYRWFDDHYSSFLYIDRVVVAPTARRRGVGRKLYEDFAGFAAGRADRLTCEVNVRPPNEGSLRFHHTFGFAEVGRQETEGGAKEVYLLAMDLSGEAASDQNNL